MACVVVMASGIIVPMRPMRTVHDDVPAGAIDVTHNSQRDVAVGTEMLAGATRAQVPCTLRHRERVRTASREIDGRAEWAWLYRWADAGQLESWP